MLIAQITCPHEMHAVLQSGSRVIRHNRRNTLLVLNQNIQVLSNIKRARRGGTGRQTGTQMSQRRKNHRQTKSARQEMKQTNNQCEKEEVSSTLNRPGILHKHEYIDHNPSTNSCHERSMRSHHPTEHSSAKHKDKQIGQEAKTS